MGACNRTAGSLIPSLPVVTIAVMSTAVASAASLLAPPSAQAAVVVTVDGSRYEVKSSQYTLQNYESLRLAQPWYGSQVKAEAFANAVAAQLGYPNRYTINHTYNSQPFSFASDYGPVFIFQASYPVPNSAQWGASVFGPKDSFPLQGQALSAFLSDYQAQYSATITLNGGAISYVGPLDKWEFMGINSPSGDFIATATPITQDVPGPLPILGAGVAFGFARNMRRRLRSSR